MKHNSGSVEVRIHQLVKRFGEFIALDGINLAIGGGKLVTFLGPSGCGKTTTLRCIAGLEVPTSGEIYFDGRPIGNVPPHKRDVGFVFQNWALFPHLTVERNISFGLEMRRVSRKEIKERVKEALELVRLSGLEKRLPSQLSGGQQQRVALARALVIRPRVLLLDEPLSNLDAKLRKEMRAELRLLHEELRITTIYVTHDQQEALALSDEVVLMNKGRIPQTGTPVEVYNWPADHFVAEFMGFENFLAARVDHVGLDGEMVVETKAGRLVLRTLPSRERFSPGDRLEVAIRAEHIRFCGEEKGTTNIFTGIISALLYQGDKTVYFIELANGEKLNVVHDGPPAKERGEAVPLLLPPEALIPIKNERGDGESV